MGQVEIWKDIVGWEGLYEVSNLGNIWSAKSNYKERPKHVLAEDETVYFIDIYPELTGKEVVIKGSYGDLYGTAGNGGGYHVVFLDGSNEVAWIGENQMEFIEVGGEHLFQTINENKAKR